MTRTGRMTRGTFTAVAAAAALALSAPSVGAATVPDQFSGTGEALAVDLRLTAPGLGAIVPDGSETLLQKISLTEAALDSEDTVRAATSLLTGALDQGNLSSEDGDSGSSQQLSIPEQSTGGILSLGAGTVEYTADAGQDLARSFSELLHLKATLKPVFDGSLGVPSEATEPIREGVEEVTKTVNGLVGELNTALDGVEQTLEDTTGEIVDIPQVTPDEVPQVPDLTTVDLLEVRKMWSESTVHTTDGKIRSETESGIAEASLLGDLVVVPAFQYRSWAETAGEPGTAAADTEVTTVAVQVAGSDVVKVAGSTLQVGDVTVDLNDLEESTGLPADEVLDPVTSALTDILNAVGLSVAQGEGATDVAEDGSSASAATSAFSLRLTPLHAAGVVGEQIGSPELQAAAGSVDLQLDLLNTKSVTAAGNVEPAPPADEPSLPRTGGGAFAAMFGLAAIGGAGWLRRRG